MPSHNRFFSIKRMFIWTVMGVTSLALLVTSVIFTYSILQNDEKQLKEEAATLAEMLSRISAEQVHKEDGVTLNNMIQILEAAHLVTNAHVYKIEENGELSFFASYNRTGRAPVSAMFTRVDELKQPILKNGIWEIINPVIWNSETIGYTYLRATTQSLENSTFEISLGSAIVVLIVLLLSFVLTLRLQRPLTEPIHNLINLVHIVAQKKDYSQRAEKTSIRELDVLARAFNTMLERIQAHNQKQKDAETEYRNLAATLEETVNQRTLALKEANQELIQTLEKLHQFQRQMVENEKMASLGDMVAGVAHEVNTPIGLGVTASTMMLDRLQNIKDDFENKVLKASSLEKFIVEGEENLNIIYRNLNRAAELISSFKQVAVDQSSESARKFKFIKLLDEVLLSLRPRLRSLAHKIDIDCDPTLCIESKAGPINQVLINLIMNSVIHGFENKEEGHIRIAVRLIEDSQLQIMYSDDGVGIPEHIQTRIFDPFVTTKRGQGGSGLGMHLVYNLVTQALNGSITLDTKEGKGVNFTITFPIEVLH
ncbi:ATP-binding protein [Alteromonas sp. a30]|uniref:ATP-binding protein n=1 Tax=Alteromonas sp. a30 TaxID=2730917 RepID=UPI002280A1E3|nr:ATP-binding protein [Alteromonas sp. a30]MCY7297341.1 HAMP domain-containing protein [Alteromonas sp. a30]